MKKINLKFADDSAFECFWENIGNVKQNVTIYTAQKMKFPLGISSVIAAKSVVSCDASYFPH